MFIFPQTVAITVIPNEPTEVTIQKQRTEVLVNKILLKIPDDKILLLPTSSPLQATSSPSDTGTNNHGFKLQQYHSADAEIGNSGTYSPSTRGAMNPLLT